MSEPAEPTHSLPEAPLAAETALRASEIQYRRLFEAAKDGILMLDAESGEITAVNPFLTELLSYEAAEVLGKKLWEISPFEDQTKSKILFKELKAKDYVRYDHLPLETRRGRLIDVEFVSNIYVSGGRRVIQCNIRDITERRNAERAQKMEVIGRLAGGVAHDFNNLLTVMLGFCEMLLDGSRQAGRDRSDIEEIQKAAMRAAELTKQLLAFSRKEIIDLKLLDVGAILDEMRPMLGRLIREDVRVVFGIQPGLAAIKADRGQLEQVIVNLAVNAQDAMPTGGTLTIEAANIKLDGHYSAQHFNVTPGPYVVIAVSDSGAGMSREVQEHLFEPFFTTKPTGQGTGLGLATVHSIVSRIGGSVTVDSEPGRGSTLKVYLPKADNVSAVKEVPDQNAPSLRGTERVLIVEDADGLRNLTKRLLEKHGYTVVVAANAAEAIERFNDNPSLDLLLTDVVMPGQSGPALAKQLLERRPELKVIYMSGYTDEAIVQRGVLLPGIAFLQKPFTAKAVARKLREVLDPPGLAPTPGSA